MLSEGESLCTKAEDGTSNSFRVETAKRSTTAPPAVLQIADYTSSQSKQLHAWNPQRRLSVASL